MHEQYLHKLVRYGLFPSEGEASLLLSASGNIPVNVLLETIM